MSLSALLAPRSIAILGASDRASIGRALIESLDRMGFKGEVLPINPKYPELFGRRCYASVDELPGPPDVVAFCVSFARVRENLERVAKKGARGAVIYDGGFAERGEAGKALQEAVVSICREAGIALNGPNCMGILNPVNRTTTYMQEVREAARLNGSVGLISQSGSVCIGMLADLRRFGYSHVISSGNEAVVTLVDYLDVLIDEPATKVIGLFIESVRNPERFVAALDRAADAGKPVVVLKVGRSARTQRAVTSHTGGLAGESRVFSEIVRSHRAIEVDDLDAFTEVLAVCQSKVLPSGPRIAVITASGGQAELILDVAENCGIDLPPLPADIFAATERVVGPLVGDGNPLDAWGNGDFRTNFPHALSMLDANPLCDNVVLCTDAFDLNPMGRPERAIDYARFAVDAAAKSRKPHFVMGMRPGIMQVTQIDFLREHGLVAIGGSRQGLGAVAQVGKWAAPLPPYAASRTVVGGGIATLVAGAPRASIHEADAKRLLAAQGMPVTREQLTQDVEEAQRAAGAIGFPIVLKAVSDAIPHKSDLGLVCVGLRDESEVRNAWNTLAEHARQHDVAAVLAGILVQEMVSGGIEVFAGVTRDPDFGLMLAFGMGGIAIELLDDFSLRPLPLRVGDARAMIERTKTARLLAGARTRTAYDIDALVECIEAFAAFAHAEREHIAEIDLNPIIVLPAGRGCRIVDALIVPRH
ncbi:MAG: acetate--CoA ligase family protein [Burkholderiales bacterium]